MNLILVLIDSLNRSALAAYGPTRVKTPHLDAFARRAWRFDNHFVGSLPCMPARREIYSGFKELLWRPWGPLEPFDARLPESLAEAGFATAIVTDHYHYWEENATGYLQSFQGAEFIRGHEIDFWRPLQPESSLPQWVRNIERWRPGFGRRYYSNVHDFSDETDFFPAKVMTAASSWLRARPPDQPFFLQVESFDVHEPFDSPEPYRSMYGDGDARDRFTLWPPYQDATRLAAFMDQASPEELAFVRAQYDGKVTMVDRWFGELTATLDGEGLWDDTCVIVTTDHGHDLGQRRAYGKQFPHYDSHANIPLLMWHPAYPGGGRAISGLTATVDLFATALAVADLAPPEATHSRNLLPLLTGESAGRPALLYGTFGQGVCCTDGEWTLIKSPVQDGPLYAYTSTILRPKVLAGAEPPVESGPFMPGVGLPQWRIPMDPTRSTSHAVDHGDLLFHRAADPDQTRNRWDDAPEQRDRMLAILTDLMRSEGTPVEQFARLGLAQ